MGVVYTFTYEDGGEAEAIRDWCRDEIERLNREIAYIKAKGSLHKGSGSRQRLLDSTRRSGQVRQLSRLLKTKFIEESEVDLILATK